MRRFLCSEYLPQFVRYLIACATRVVARWQDADIAAYAIPKVVERETQKEKAQMQLLILVNE